MQMWQAFPYTIGFVYLPAVLIMSLLSYFTALIGARMAYRLAVAPLKKVFGMLLMLLSANVLLSVW